MDVSNPTKRGRRRLEMKKVEDEAKRAVTFTKRRKGLFKKACELSELSGAKIAVFVISERGKPYSCGDVDSILDQYLTGKVPDSSPESNAASQEAELLRKECKETLLKLEEETKKQREEKTGFWWEKSVDERMEEWLKEYEANLVQLKRNVEAKLEERRRKKTEASTSTARDRDHDHQVRGLDHEHQGVIPTVDQFHHDHHGVIPTVDQPHHDHHGVIPTVDQPHHDHQGVIPTVDQPHHDHQGVIPTVDQPHYDGLVFDDSFRIEDFVGLDGFDFHAKLF